MHPKEAVLHSTFRFLRPINSIYIYILTTWVVAIEISRTCTECLRAQSLCLFFFQSMRYPLHLQSQLQTWHFLAQTSRKDDVTADAITTSGRLRDVWKIVVQQVGSKQCRGCVFQGVVPLFPLGTVARAWASKTFFVITNCFASIDSWFDFQQYDAGILFSSLSLVVPYSALFLLFLSFVRPLLLLLLCPFVLSTCRFYRNPPTSICLWIFDLQGQPHVRDKDAKVYADPPTPRIEEPVFVIQPIHLQPFGTPKKDLNLQVTILSFMYTNNLNILKNIDLFHFATFSTISFCFSWFYSKSWGYWEWSWKPFWSRESTKSWTFWWI